MPEGQTKYTDILKHYWGYDSFRGVQEQIVESIGNGTDTLGLMPTGGGKSVTFQVPAMAMEGVCIVVTPLIALMKDQVRNLRDRGIKAAAIHTGMSRDKIIAVMENCIYGGTKFLYISPERIASELFQAKLRHIKVCLITVDESHCISQWGYDFRPSYLNVSEIRKLLPGVPVLALTATATPRVVDDIQDRLGFSRHNVIRMSFYRENLSYVVRNTENKMQELLHILEKVPGCAIVYVRNRTMTREISDQLNSCGISSTFYHAGLEQADKDMRQQSWTDGTHRVIVATNAFGMGIDKPDVRLVVHMDTPDSIEAYFQEAGRGGRDGLRSYAVLLHSPGDNRTLSKRVSDTFPKIEFIRNVYEKLAYWFQMAMGDGRGCSFGFSAGEFCRHYSLPVIQTESALRLLTRMGYIEYTEDAEYSANVRFTTSRDDLYRIHSLDSDTENILSTIMRLYCGLFTDGAYIDEQLVCSRTGVDSHTLYDSLIRAQQHGVVRYVPSRRTPVLKWTRERVESSMLFFDPEIYDRRLEEYRERIRAMSDYVNRQTGCRSCMLLEYFGEKKSEPCGNCDICLGHAGGNLKRGEYASVSAAVIDFLNSNPEDAAGIYTLPFRQEVIDEVVRIMVREELICIDDGRLAVVEKK